MDELSVVERIRQVMIKTEIRRVELSEYARVHEVALCKECGREWDADEYECECPCGNVRVPMPQAECVESDYGDRTLDGRSNWGRRERVMSWVNPYGTEEDEARARPAQHDRYCEWLYYKRGA